MTRLNRSAQRRVFRRKRRIPVAMVIRQLIVILLLLSGGIGIVVLLQRLPEQVDLMVLVSQAISDLISGIQLLMLAGLWRLLRLLRLLLFPSRSQAHR